MKVKNNIFSLDSFSCAEVKVLLSHYLDGELLLNLSNRFEKHLSECVGCASLVEDCKHVVSLAGELHNVPVPEGVRTRLRHTLGQMIAEDNISFPRNNTDQFILRK